MKEYKFGNHVLFFGFEYPNESKLEQLAEWVPKFDPLCHVGLNFGADFIIREARLMLPDVIVLDISLTLVEQARVVQAMEDMGIRVLQALYWNEIPGDGRFKFQEYGLLLPRIQMRKQDGQGIPYGSHGPGVQLMRS